MACSLGIIIPSELAPLMLLGGLHPVGEALLHMPSAATAAALSAAILNAARSNSGNLPRSLALLYLAAAIRGSAPGCRAALTRLQPLGACRLIALAASPMTASGGCGG